MVIELEELKRRWNSNADQYNRWDELGLEEKVAFAQEECLKEPSARMQELTAYLELMRIVHAANRPTNAIGNDPWEVN